MWVGLSASSPSLQRSLIHDGPDQPRVAADSQAPNPLQQLVVGQHHAGIDRQLEEHRVLGGGQLHRTPANGYPPLAVVDAQVSQQKGFGRLSLAGAGPPARGRLVLAASSAGEKGLTICQTQMSGTTRRMTVHTCSGRHDGTRTPHRGGRVGVTEAWAQIVGSSPTA